MNKPTGLYIHIPFCKSKCPYCDFYSLADADEYKKEYKKAVKCAINNVKKYFPNYRKNRYFYKSFKGIYLILFNSLIANIYYNLRKR